MAYLTKRGLVVYFDPPTITAALIIDTSKKPCTGALDLLDDLTYEFSLISAGRVLVFLTVTVDKEMKTKVASAIHNMKAASTENIFRSW